MVPADRRSAEHSLRGRGTPFVDEYDHTVHLTAGSAAFGQKQTRERRPVRADQLTCNPAPLTFEAGATAEIQQPLNGKSGQPDETSKRHPLGESVKTLRALRQRITQARTGVQPKPAASPKVSFAKGPGCRFNSCVGKVEMHGCLLSRNVTSAIVKVVLAESLWTD
jgi:hypothetical protein